MAGSEVFEATVYRLQQLNAASQEALATLQSSWRAGQLADDFPALVRVHSERLPPQLGEAIQEHLRNGRTGLFDSHPADRDRIESARRQDSVGIFRLQAPATILFRDFEGLSKRVTKAFYRQLLERDVPASNLLPAAALVGGERALETSLRLLRRYFMGAVPILPPLWLAREAVADEVEDLRDAYRQLKEARREVETGATEARQRIRRCRMMEERALRAAQAHGLLRAGYRIDPADFGLVVPAVEEAAGATERALAGLREAARPGEPYRAAARRRLTLALRLIHHPQARERIEHVDEVVAESRHLLAVLDDLRTAFEEVDGLRHSSAALAVLLQVLENNPGTDAARGVLHELCEELGRRLSRLRRDCRAGYPFRSGTRPLTIGHYLVENVPPVDDVAAVASRSNETIERLYALYGQVLAGLVGIAARVEGALGLPPLPDVPDDGAE